jgi:hypothetical protein
LCRFESVAVAGKKSAVSSSVGSVTTPLETSAAIGKAKSRK